MMPGFARSPKPTALFMVAALTCVSAHAADWRTSWDGALYGYLGETAVDVALAPPVNQIFQVAQHNRTAEARLNLKAESETLRISARPILLAQGGTQTGREAYLSQWQMRWRAAENWSVSAGRELLNWGPAQFRSPSSPYYFDNGRSNPLRELSGLDAQKLSWTPDAGNALTLAHLSGSGHARANPDPWHDSWLLRWEPRGEDWAAGLTLARAGSPPVFVGLHAQYTPDDAWLLYGEAGSGARPGAVDAVVANALGQIAPRHGDWLLGASYTLESGSSVYAEWMRNGHGLSAVAQPAAFNALTWMSALATAPLLGRDYLHLVWQSSLMDDGGTARLMATHGFDGTDNELAAYAERHLNGRASLFALAAAGQSGSFIRQNTRSLSAGVRVALP